MKKNFLALGLIAIMALPVPAADSKERDRHASAAEVAKEIMDIPDDIPQNVIDKADCVVVMPSVIKGAFIVGASYGRGLMTCRSGDNFQGPWGAPTMMALEGGSFGFQIGGQATDFVLLLMNTRAASRSSFVLASAWHFRRHLAHRFHASG
jgi:lipid-binding SYLF domain-containing protein